MSRQINSDMSDLIEVAVQRMLVEPRTATVGQVTAFRRATGGEAEYVKIQPGLRRILQDLTTLDMPEVDRVPILWPGGSGFSSGVDLVPGDEVLCVVSDRAIDTWIQSGGIQTPPHGRLQDITDIVVLPGLLSHGNSATVRRGANTWYLGDKSGIAPWLRLDRGVAKSVTIEATTIKFGEQAGLGVARQTDKVHVQDAAWITWLNAVGVASMVGAPPLPQPIGNITSSSGKTKSE